MNSSGPKVVSFDFSVHWLFIPPITAIFTILAAGLLSTGIPISVDPAIWGLVVLMFVLLTVLYGIFIKRDFLSGLFPVQLIAQGILLCPLALRMGGNMLQWVGVLLAICGAVVLVALYYRPQAELGLPYVMPQTELDALPLPFAITDDKGYIISASDFLLRLLQKTRAAINGKKINSLLSLDTETASVGGKEWKILRTPMEDGTQYFQLEEVRDAPVTLPLNFSDDFVDSATSLYNRSYAVKRVEEELYRIYRYKRWMSAALLRVLFQENEASSSSNVKKEDEIFNAYCRFINSSTRETDISCLVGPTDILLVMPETQLEGAQDVVGKLTNITAHLKEETAGSNCAVKIHEGVVFFSASSGILDFDRMMAKLDEALKS